MRRISREDLENMLRNQFRDKMNAEDVQLLHLAEDDGMRLRVAWDLRGIDIERFVSTGDLQDLFGIRESEDDLRTKQVEVRTIDAVQDQRRSL